jgi:hypothetical protein
MTTAVVPRARKRPVDNRALTNRRSRQRGDGDRNGEERMAEPPVLWIGDERWSAARWVLRSTAGSTALVTDSARLWAELLRMNLPKLLDQ